MSGEDLRDEIEAALTDAAPGEDEKADWAREALARAEATPGPRLRRLPGRWFLAAAAAASILVAAWQLWPAPETGAAPTPTTVLVEEDVPPRPTRITKEDITRDRAANDAAFRSAGVQERLAAAPEGSYALIFGGGLVALDRDPKVCAEALRRIVMPLIEKRDRNIPAHGYFFRVGTEGDVEYESTWPYEQVAGMAFLKETGLAFAMGPDGCAFWSERSPPADLEKIHRFPSPDRRPYIGLALWPCLMAGDAPEPTAAMLAPSRMSFLLATGFGGPLILPPEAHWETLEIPGIASVKAGIGGSVRRYRRKLVRALAPECGLDRLVEAIGDPLDPAPAFELGGKTWPRYSPDLAKRAEREGKPLLLLVLDCSAGVKTDPWGFESVRKRLDDFVLARHHRPWVKPHGLRLPEGGYRSRSELVSYAPPNPDENPWTGEPDEDLLPILRHGFDGGGSALADLEKYLDRAGAIKSPWGNQEAHLEYRVQWPVSAVPYRTPDGLQEIKRTLEKRLEGTGCAVRVQVQGDVPHDLVLVVVPRPAPARLALMRAACERIGSLALRFVYEEGDPKEGTPDYPAFEVLPWEKPKEDGERKSSVVRIDRWNFTERDLERVRVTPSHARPDEFVIQFGIVKARERDFGEFTGPNSAEESTFAEGRRLAIILDGKIVSAPHVRSRLTDAGYIEGGFTRVEAEGLALALRSGCLPAPLRLASIVRFEDGKLLEREEAR